MTSRTQKLVIAAVVIAFCVLLVLGFIVGAAVVGWRSAVRAGNEAATIQNLKTIAAVETQYFNTHNRMFATFEELMNEQMLSSKFAGNPPVADGYVLTLSVARKPDGSSSWYKVTADPLEESTGRNHFYLDSDDGRIRMNAERHAGPDDPFQ